MKPPPGSRPAEPAPGGGGPPRAEGQPAGGPDPLDELSQRVRAAQQAAERILAESREAAGPTGGEGSSDESGAGERPPHRGYAGGGGPRRAGNAEAQALLALLELGRGVVPPELRRALADLVRELLLLMRALIDWYLERLEERRRTPAEVEDIPIS